MKRMGLLFSALGLFLFIQSARADWTPAQRLTYNSGDSKWPAVAVDSVGNLHLVWCDSTPSNYEIYYRKSTDGGTTWTSAQRLTWTSGNSIFPAIAVDSSDNLHVVWCDSTPSNYEIYYKKSTDGGITWTSAKRLTWSSGVSWYPAIAVGSSGHLYMVWQDDTPGNEEIYYSKSVDGGATWSSAQRLTWTALFSGVPAIIVDSSGYLHIVWYDSTPGNNEIYYKKSTNGGANWTSAQRLTYALGGSMWPAIAVDSSGPLHLVWADNKLGDFDIYYRKTLDGGDTWTSAQRLTWNSGASWYPAIAVISTGHLHVVWEDNMPGNFEIYYKKSTDGGSTWSSSQRLTWNSGSSEYPVVAVDSTGHLHVVWQDDTPGNLEIYYKKSK
jgi:predicted neuraminidase